jgi:DNA-binding IscR family transcriptional regulator
MGLPHCDDSKPCPVHEVWSRTRAQVLAQLSSRTLKDLAAATDRAGAKTGSKIRGSYRRSEGDADSGWDNARNR